MNFDRFFCIEYILLSKEKICFFFHWIFFWKNSDPILYRMKCKQKVIFVCRKCRVYSELMLSLSWFCIELSFPFDGFHVILTLVSSWNIQKIFNSGFANAFSFLFCFKSERLLTSRKYNHSHPKAFQFSINS